MSRDRRQRGNRERRQDAPGDQPSEGGVIRSGLPAAISGEVDEFDAALVRGAHGVPAPDGEDEPRSGAERETTESAGSGGGNGRGADTLRGDAYGDGEEGGSGLPAPRQRAQHPAERQSLPTRAAAFGRASWAELQRVQWPGREQVFQATFVVLGFVAVAGIYLFAADWVAEHIIKVIL
ncbi:MAG: preprotein translocase subunit SecE [Solirubrobacteraceae bacterium]